MARKKRRDCPGDILRRPFCNFQIRTIGYQHCSPIVTGLLYIAHCTGWRDKGNVIMRKWKLISVTANNWCLECLAYIFIVL